MDLKCGNCGSTKLKNMKERGFTNGIVVNEKTVTEPVIYYCYECGKFSCEENVYQCGETNDIERRD